ncbi:MAG TPA: glycosyltransferase family 4 protein [Thermoanaerobaculia bacterium]|nr:glycosyltransferase family 4 protein [Thermoanaerobaculia bacterium]
MSSLRMLFMADVPEDPSSGAAGTEVQTIRALRRLGHEVDAIWSDSLPRRIAHGNLHYLLELPRAYRALMLERSARAPYDVVQINQPHGWLAAREHARRRLPGVFVHRSHGLEVRAERELRRWRERYGSDERSLTRRLTSRFLAPALHRHTKEIVRWADGHIVYCEACAELLRDELGVSRDRIGIVGAAAPDEYTVAPALPMSEERMRRVLYAGQYAFFKAPMIVAEIFRQLAERDSSIEMTWVCSSRHHESVRTLLPPEVQARVALRDWGDQAALRRIYDEHGIFVFPSFFEGFGKVFLEAMARGLCVVSSSEGGARDVITDGVDGFLTDTGDAEAMVGRCALLLGEAPRMNEMSVRAAETARRFTWDGVAEKTVDFFHELLDSKGREKR